jgi:hypothetical protein
LTKKSLKGNGESESRKEIRALKKISSQKIMVKKMSEYRGLNVKDKTYRVVMRLKAESMGAGESMTVDEILNKVLSFYELNREDKNGSK